MSFKPAKYPQFFVYLKVRACEAAIEFYTKAFDFKVIDSVPGEDGRIQHAELKYGEAVVMMAPEGAWGDTVHKAPVSLGVLPSSNFYLYVEDVDAFYKQAISAGAISLMEPHDSFWGDRCCCLRDQEGYEWMFATYLNKEEVNA